MSAGCDRQQSGASGGNAGAGGTGVEPPLVAECEPGVPGGRLILSGFGDPKTFNPITQNETSSGDIIDMMFIGLLEKDEQTQEMRPGLAHRWEVAEDNRTWTFHLRQGLRWSDGQPLTAGDVLFTFNDVIYNKDIINVEVDKLRVDGKDFEVTQVDELTIRVVTPAVFAPFLEAFGKVMVVPKHALAAAVAEKRFESAYGLNTPPDQLVCSGPFRLKQFKPGEFTLLERNPHFLAVDSRGQRLPYFDAVVYMVVPDQNAMSLRFLKGESHLLEFVRPEEHSLFKQASEKGGKFNLIELGIASQIDLITFNQNTGTNKAGRPYVDPVKLKWFRNTKFRQAISYAIDRPSIVKSSLNGLGRPNYGFITESNTKWFNPDIMQYPHDPAKAKALLAEIGIRDRDGDGWLEDETGRVIEFEMNTNAGNSRREQGAVIVQEDLKRLGIKVQFRPLEFNTLVAKLDSAYDFECIYLGLASESTDPADSMNVLISSGFTHQWFPRQKTPSTPWEARIDELMNAQMKSLDFAGRKQAFDEVQAILAEQMPMIPTTAMNAYSAARKDLRNLKPTAHHHNRLVWNIEELYFAGP
jgi:peptide/nickel transport system substrate-binding protein